MAFAQDNIQVFFLIVTSVSALGLGILWIAWMQSIGPWRASLAAICRGLWLLPLFLSFFPQTISQELPRALALKPVQILVDDSQSMRVEGEQLSQRAQQADDLVKLIESECARHGCMPKVSRLSQLDADTKLGYTPLSNGLQAWLYKNSSDPWVLISDGGDYLPTERWPQALKSAGINRDDTRTPRGLIVGFSPKSLDNVWLKDFSVPPFSFEDKPLVVEAVVQRSHIKQAELIQLQVMTGDRALATVNAAFGEGENQTSASATIPPLPRGQHLLSLRALPTASETTLWDNTMHAQVEVMPNTVGVLHLLGGPSFDGRFLRRYLKAEPKYDLISFFILRDPWDSQQADERELSLIPFPVERLFREELPNFRVVILQNFTLFQFLLPEYQQNLVKFVQEGGGLLFIGGARALQSADLQSSPLREILPFQIEPSQLGPLPIFGFDEVFLPSDADDQKGPSYDESLPFQVEFANPEPVKRSLANVYDDWESLEAALTGWKSAKGLHHMERVKFKTDNVTPLLTAKTAQGDIPLAVASYPGKGRAIWLFSDAMWRLAMSPNATTSRETYNRFMQTAMTWLMRQDLKKPLVAKNFQIFGDRRRAASWRVSLQGPAARYYEPGVGWQVTVCGSLMPEAQLSHLQTGADEWELSGPMPVALAGGERCLLHVEGKHAAFGSVKAQITGIFPEAYPDSELDAAPQKLEQLAALTGAALTLPPQAQQDELSRWLEKISGHEGAALPSRFKTLRNFFWVIERPWFWLLMLLLPLEVVIRRWDQLVGGGLGKTSG